jgi:hypothetical protein
MPTYQRSMGTQGQYLSWLSLQARCQAGLSPGVETRAASAVVKLAAGRLRRRLALPRKRGKHLPDRNVEWRAAADTERLEAI